MRASARGLVTFAFLCAGLTYGSAVYAQNPAPAPAASPTRTHMGHVADAFRDTPEGKGFLPTAMGEAQVVVTHANLMAGTTDNLDMMKRHAGHIIHAIDPALETTGPGLGYGLKKASDNAASHITLAGAAEGASQSAKTHSNHIATSAKNTSARAEKILALAQQIKAATVAEDAAKLVAELKTLSDQLVAGVDANADGRVGWQEGEGGLAAADQHMGLMKTGEGPGL